jgi:uncharacterized protein YkwD
MPTLQPNKRLGEKTNHLYPQADSELTVTFLVQTRYNNAIMRQRINRLVMVMVMLIVISALSYQPASAQTGTASEMIATVNSLRQSQGLAPYTVDSYLMDFAQSHSNYMASIGTWTHTRADGTTAFDVGIKENVAMGTNMSVQYCVYTVWSDWVHWETMTGFSGGKVGAGVTVADGNVYYTLNVLPEDSVVQDITNPAAQDEPVAALQSQPEEATAVFISSVITSTPDESGIIIHTVQYGETLWTIAEAYGVTIDVILTNSSLPLSTTEVFEGQRLIIQTATEPTATPTFTPTVDPGTPTPTQPRPTLTPFPTRTPAPTHTPTPPPSIIHRAFGEGKNVGIGLILICGLGLAIVVYVGFIKKS